MKTLVLGLGNTLLGDEGVGVYAIRRMQETLGVSGDVAILDGGTLSFTLAGPIEDADNLIIIDAAQLNDAPGTVRLYEGEEMDRFVTTNNKSSVHEVSLADLMVIAHLTDKLPKQRALIGIQPQSLDWSHNMTPAVAEAVPTACELAHELITRWTQPSA
ncbi:MAG: HyaD/HybD family hydrogenase maturation endopeptidase [Chromatiales bacterium]|nr:HyaD/HybD family hydrogenase maturation endopeptidase [Chromatiales bacterium]